MSSVTGAVARWISPVLAFATVVGLVWSAGAAPSPAVRLTSDTNPLAGRPFYVDPISAAMSAAKNASPPNAVLTAIANTPQAYWLDQAFPAPSVANTVARYVGAAQAAGSMPVLVIYAIPHRVRE
jgi:endoglucanase